jgi:hypothetical protein
VFDTAPALINKKYEFNMKGTLGMEDVQGCSNVGPGPRFCCRQADLPVATPAPIPTPLPFIEALAAARDRGSAGRLSHLMRPHPNDD